MSVTDVIVDYAHDAADRQPPFAVVKLSAGEDQENQAEISTLHERLVAHPGRTLRDWLESPDESLPELPRLLDWTQLDPYLRISAVFEPVQTELIQQLRAERGRPAKDFAAINDPLLQQYIRFEVNPFDAEAVGSLARLQETLLDTEHIIVESVVIGGTVGEPPEGAAMTQLYHHDPADGGIGVKYVQEEYQRGCGENTWFVDVEQGWSLPHDELAGRYWPDTISGVNRDWIWSSAAQEFAPVGWHGLMILGLVAGNRTGGALTGIAPESFGFLASEWEKRPRTPYTANTAQAIKAAADLLDPGDVILIEGQRYFAKWKCNLPVEADPDVFEAIRYATSRNITVIEPAGNNDLKGVHQGGVKLDGYMDELGLSGRDSGAILVAAGNNNLTDVTFTRRRESNYGQRVNCFADGDKIWSLDPPGWAGDSLNGYHEVTMGGTSTAAAIIAGVALVLQGIQRADDHVISAAKMRDLLSDPNNGVKIVPNDPDQPFGVMPNLIKMEAANGGTLTGLGNVKI